MAVPQGHTIRGLNEFLRELGQANRKLAGQALREGNKEAADIIARETQAQASRDRVASKAAGQVRAAADRLEAKITFNKTNRFPYVLGAFFGARRFKQFRPWVGNQYTAGDAGGIHTDGMPYHAAEAIEAKDTEFLDAYGDILERALARAFPD